MEITRPIACYESGLKSSGVSGYLLISISKSLLGPQYKLPHKLLHGRPGGQSHVSFVGCVFLSSVSN